ncbi:MAG: hypothetical protein JXQ97_02400 [Natronospirillum sp.]
MEKLDAMINTFNTDQVLRQSDVDSFNSQMTERQDLFSSAQLSLSMELSEAMYRKIQINSYQGSSFVSTDEKAMDVFFRTGVGLASFTMGIVNEDYDIKSYIDLLENNPKGFYLPAISSSWDTEYDNLIRFMHSFLEP